MVFIIKSMYGYVLEMEENYVLSFVILMYWEIDLFFVWFF